MLGCLEILFTIGELALYGIVALGVILVVVGMILALGSGAYYEAGAVNQAGMGCSFAFFVGLGLILVAALWRRR
jgi:hypothetical protein